MSSLHPLNPLHTQREFKISSLSYCICIVFFYLSNKSSNSGSSSVCWYDPISICVNVSEYCEINIVRIKYITVVKWVINRF